MRLVATGGGTAGHVVPALAIIEALFSESEEAQENEVLFIGSKHGMEAQLVAQTGLPFAGIAAEGLRGMGPAKMLRHTLSLARGIADSWRVLRRFRPQVVLATGGYVSAPVVVASWLRRVPRLIYLPDIVPGLAVRVLAPLASRIAVTAPQTARALGNKAVTTGYPVRSALREVDRTEARLRLGMEPGRPLLLVFGGSRGAHSINMAVRENLTALTQEAQVLHICGTADQTMLDEARATLPAGHVARYHVAPYLHEEMVCALVAADLAVSRAGASVLGELPAVRLPAILVPYPYAGKHQEQNARYLAGAGAALIVDDTALPDRLVPLVSGLLADSNRRMQMRDRLRELDRPDAARKIVRWLRAIAKVGNFPIEGRKQQYP